MTRRLQLAGLILIGAASLVSGAHAQKAAGPGFDYKIVATNKTSTMEKELNAAGALGFRFMSMMGGETAFGGKEVVIVMGRTESAPGHYVYKLLATNRTSTMQKELSAAAEAGFEYRGQSINETTFGGEEVICVLERERDAPARATYDYKLLATSKTSTMEKELKPLGDAGYEAVGLTVAKTSFGGSEVVVITRRRIQ